MIEAIEHMMFLAGLFLMIVLPIGGLAALVDYTTTKRMEKYKLNEFDAQRQADNNEILDILADYIDKHPTQRFGQILKNLDVFERKLVAERGMEEWETGNLYIDHQLVHDEPSIILARMKKALAEQEES